MTDNDNEIDIKLSSIVPKVYDDVVSPAAKEIGDSLVVVAKTVKIALVPLRTFVWGYEQIEDFIVKKVSRKLKDVPKEKIITPPANIAVPTIEALRYCADNDLLKDLFANLLTTSMQKDKVSASHPAFVEIIKQISPDEARILFYFSEYKANDAIASATATVDTWGTSYIRSSLFDGLDYLGDELKLIHPKNLSTYLENLIRLGVFYIQTDYTDDLKDSIDSTFRQVVENIKDNQSSGSFFRTSISTDIDISKEREDQLCFTDFGQQFLEACVISNEAKAN